MSSKKYNITAIAKLAGVSPATVSRALNNHPYVTKEVHDKVFDAVHRLGYQPRMPSDRKRLAIIIDNRNMILNSYANTMLFHLNNSEQESGCSVFTDQPISLAMAYVPTQKWDTPIWSCWRRIF